MPLFRIKITIDYWPKKSEKYSILLGRFERNKSFRGLLLKVEKCSILEGRFENNGSLVVAPFGIKMTIDYQPKNSKKC